MYLGHMCMCVGCTVCGWIQVSVHASTSTCIHAQGWWQEQVLGVFLYWSLLTEFCIRTGSLTEPETQCFCKAGWPQSSGEYSCLPSRAGVTSSQSCSDFYMGAGDLNLGPHTFRASAHIHGATFLAQDDSIFDFFKYYTLCERTIPYNEPKWKDQGLLNVQGQRCTHFLKWELEV